MSGNSGSGVGPSISSPNGDENCSDLVINTYLSSPQADIIKDLNVADLLTVHATSAQGPIQVINEKGQLAGNIISKEQVRLLNCINNGTEYIAEIIELEDGACKIQIRAK